MEAAIVVLTKEPGEGIREVLAGINRQGQVFKRRVVMDSNSEDGTCAYAEEYGFEVLRLGEREFNHGATRAWCVSLLADVDVVVFLTQDALLASVDSVERLLAYFADESVGAAYGRQLPYPDASPLAAHARLFNYTARPQVKSYEDRASLGIKTPFLSDSFAAYRLSALQAVGGFPERVIIGEDMYAGARLLQAGYRVAYAADAAVYHSHDYSLGQDFRRYFDTGVFQQEQPWIREAFGGAEGTGLQFVRSQLAYLWGLRAYGALLSAVLHNGIRLLGYRAGLLHCLLPSWLCRKLSGQAYYFR